MAGSSSAASRAHSSTHSQTPLITHRQLVHCRSLVLFRLVMSGRGWKAKKEGPPANGRPLPYEYQSAAALRTGKY
ncbi:hypothetical protein, partial [Bacteroides caccae]|uniref:hypothetical protein n=1 Tax=Bacteroides caccae TaxID=47678 RepID=UPI001961D200